MIKTKHILMIPLITLIGLLMLTTDGLSAGIKERMKARIPEINKLKKAGVVGENKLGYLEVVGKHSKQNAVVAAENKDRKKVYAAIAKQQGVTAGAVGKRRALQIADRAAPGEWLQNQNGKWVQKK